IADADAPLHVNYAAHADEHAAHATEHAEHGGGDHPAPGGDGASHLAHHDGTGPLHDHRDCPRCYPAPAEGVLGAGHVDCSVADAGTAAPAASTSAPADLKPFLAPIAWIEPVAASPPARARPPAAPAAVPPPTRSLNVRYCVLLL